MKNDGLTAQVLDGSLVISIGVDTLAKDIKDANSELEIDSENFLRDVAAELTAADFCGISPAAAFLNRIASNTPLTSAHAKLREPTENYEFNEAS
jgi:hypothetical protein